MNKKLMNKRTISKTTNNINNHNNMQKEKPQPIIIHQNNFSNIDQDINTKI
jgi:hypothetical protein